MNYEFSNGYQNMKIMSTEKNPIVIVGKTSNGSNKYEFLYKGEYVTIGKLKKLLSSESKSLENWYDEYVLSLNDNTICPICNKNKRKFCDLHTGYYKTCSDKECQSKILSLAGINRYSDPHERDRTSKATQLATSTPEARRRNSEAQLKSYRENPGRREIQRIRQLERYEDPNEHLKTKESVRAVRSTSESREKSRISAINSWNNPTDRRFNSCGNAGKKYYSESIWENGKVIRFDSSWELKFFNLCESKNVSKLLRCRMFIKYYNPIDLRESRYLPDFILNDHYLIEVKPNYMLDDPINIAKFNAADLYCRENGLEYVILTEDYLFNNGEPFYGSMPF